jgi:hypothetical protein
MDVPDDVRQRHARGRGQALALVRRTDLLDGILVHDVS